MEKHIRYSLHDNAFMHLQKADEDMARLVKRIETIDYAVESDLFAALASSIVYQQLATRAAASIWARVGNLCPEGVNSKSIEKAGEEALRAAGLSQRKCSYLISLVRAAEEGLLDGLERDEDETVIEKLTTVKGIGRWTAEMTLIFSLGREDVISYGDGGIRRAFKKLYHMDREPSAEEFQIKALQWAPFRTAAGLCLWKSLEKGFEA